jgi:heterodisulfide reductase subunit A
MNMPVGAVLVVGGGIAGMQASLDLADAGFKVYLVEKKPTIGGTMAQLDKTFPTNDCSMCIMAPKLVATGRHHNIELITNATVELVEGKAGDFIVTLKKHPRKINEKKCTGCGTCAQKCPVEAVDEYNEGLKARRAVSVNYPQAVPLVYSIDPVKCIGCGICAQECKAGAVEYDEKDRIIELEVGSIILVPGFEKFDASVKKEYGYRVYKNVISSIEFERILSASGPYSGLVLRPSDGEIPKKIAFIQCVGSRDDKTNPYCSAVCCMYAIKEAIISKEHSPDLTAQIFFMDIRAFGKEFEDYYKRAEKEHGIKFTRCRVAEVMEKEENNNLILRYVEGGEPKEEEFDLVVLSVGLTAPEDAKAISTRFGVQLNKYGFTLANPFTPLITSREGVYAGGAFVSPKDIPDTVAQASGAAALASSIISSERGKLVSVKEYPSEMDVAGQEPRIGAFICNCGINIGSVVSVPEVVEYVKALPNVVYAEGNLYTCSQDTQERIKAKIKEHKLNRVFVASCTPRTHEPLFMNTCREAGLNPYLFEMANIREHCSWVHMHEKEKATQKAKDLVRMGIAKTRTHTPLQKSYLPLKKTALVIGGGLSGLTAALGIAEQGYEVHLVEKEAELGGNLRRIRHLLSKVDPQANLNALINKVRANKKIHIYTGATLKSIDGFVGDFKTVLTAGGADKTIEHGVVVVASGGVEYKPTEYLYGKDPNVITQLELEDRLTKGEKPKSVVMIQCIGARDEKNPNCSRICCGEAVKNALKVKEVSPEAKVTVLYKDMRTYGFAEDYYREAAEKGVTFIRYDDENKPVVGVDPNGKLHVSVVEPIVNKKFSFEPDLLVLSAATHPNPDNEAINKMLKVPLTKDKFFLEAHMKLRPVDFMTEGVFLCGLAHGPKYIDESISQALGAVARATTILSKDMLEIEPTISFVVDENCDGCAYCVDPCPYKAITLLEYARDGSIKKTVEVNEALCKGCGVCQATCPKKGIFIRRFRLDQLAAMVDAVLEV